VSYCFAGFSGTEQSALRPNRYYNSSIANRNARSGSRLIQNPPLSGNNLNLLFF
jgi:hypothetical protein